MNAVAYINVLGKINCLQKFIKVLHHNNKLNFNNNESKRTSLFKIL